MGNPDRFPPSVANGPRAMVSTPMVNVTIIDPPMFDANKFEQFRKELLWWRDLHFNITDPQLIIQLALKVTGDILKGLLSQYLEKRETFRPRGILASW